MWDIEHGSKATVLHEGEGRLDARSMPAYVSWLIGLTMGSLGMTAGVLVLPAHRPVLCVITVWALLTVMVMWDKSGR